MASPLNSSGLLQADNAGAGSVTLNAGFSFTAGRHAVFEFVFWANGDTVTGVTIGGTTATIRADYAGGISHAIVAEALNMAGGTPNIVITTNGSNGAYISGSATEWDAGVGLVYDTGTANTDANNGTAPTVSTAATTSQANTLVFAVAVDRDGSSANVFSGPSGWTVGFVEQDGSAHEAGTGAWIEETSAGTKTALWADSQGGNWGAAIAAYLLLSNVPTIDAQPVDTRVELGHVASFSVSATASAGSLSYQWQDNRTGAFTNVASGGTSATYITDATNVHFQGQRYQCVVTDSNGSTTTSTALLDLIYRKKISELDSPKAGANFFDLTLSARWLTVGEWFADEFYPSGEAVTDLTLGRTEAGDTSTAATQAALALASTPTEATDTSMAAALAALALASTSTEAPDRLDGSIGSAAAVLVGTSTEAPDTSIAAAQAALALASAPDEAADGIVAVVQATLALAGSPTEAADTLTTEVQATLALTGTPTEAAGVSTAAAQAAVSLVGTSTEASDALAAAVGPAAVELVSTLTEVPDTSTAIAQVALALASTPTEAPNTSTAAAQAAIALASEGIEAPDASTAATQATLVLVSTPTEAPDTSTVAAQAALALISSPIEDPDTLTAAAQAALALTSPPTEAPDTSTAVAQAALALGGAPTEALDISAAAAQATLALTSTSTEALDTLDGQTFTATVRVLVSDPQEALDTSPAAVQAALALAVAAVEEGDAVASLATVLASLAAAIGEAPDMQASEIANLVALTLQQTELNDAVLAAVVSGAGADVWGYLLPDGTTAGDALALVTTKLRELYKLHALLLGTSLVVAADSRTAGEISQTIGVSGNQTTVTRI